MLSGRVELYIYCFTWYLFREHTNMPPHMRHTTEKTCLWETRLNARNTTVKLRQLRK